jgi:hypothetical protein
VTADALIILISMAMYTPGTRDQTWVVKHLGQSGILRGNRVSHTADTRCLSPVTCPGTGRNLKGPPKEYAKAIEILKNRKSILEKGAELLLEKVKIEGPELKALCNETTPDVQLTSKEKL